jgi:hypothetical protein
MACADHLSTGLQPCTHVLHSLTLFQPLLHALALAWSIVHQASPAQHGHTAQRLRLILYHGAPPSETYSTCTPTTHPNVLFAIIWCHFLWLWVFVLSAVLLCNCIPQPISHYWIWLACVPGHRYLHVSFFFHVLGLHFLMYLSQCLVLPGGLYFIFHT